MTWRHSRSRGVPPSQASEACAKNGTRRQWERVKIGRGMRCCHVLTPERPGVTRTPQPLRGFAWLMHSNTEATTCAVRHRLHATPFLFHGPKSSSVTPGSRHRRALTIVIGRSCYRKRLEPDSTGSRAGPQARFSLLDRTSDWQSAVRAGTLEVTPGQHDQTPSTGS